LLVIFLAGHVFPIADLDSHQVFRRKVALLGIVGCHLPAFRDIDVEHHDEVFGGEGRGRRGQGQGQKSLDEDEGDQGAEVKALGYTRSLLVREKNSRITEYRKYNVTFTK
jgi:hypothetical protein